MYYKTNEIASLLRYESPRTFLQAVKLRTTPTMVKIWESRLPNKVGRNILWNKSQIDKIIAEDINGKPNKK